MTHFKVKVTNVDADGFLLKNHGGNAEPKYLNANALSTYSPEIIWDAVPHAKSYALECIDYDASPVCGMIFIHWVVCNITDNKLELDASKNNKQILEGVNSSTQGIHMNASLTADHKHKHNLEASGYIGPRPPNGDHTYVFNVYALDVPTLNLKKPFFIGHLHDAMRGHIIGMGKTEVKYRHVK